MTQQQTASSTPGEEYHFLVRRLHSLCGLVPVGAFLCVHLLANSTILAPGAPAAEFQNAIERIHVLGPLLVPFEIVFMVGIM